MKNKFVHLHVHTEYSLLDGLSSIGDLLKHVKEFEMDSVAITDHGVMYGAVEFYKKATKEGIKPIIGMEGYTTNLPHQERPERAKIKNYHILLLAKNQEGYKNLMKITSIAHLEGFYYRPRIDRETLAKYSKGLIATSACGLGEIAQNILADDYKEAKNVANWFLEVFGEKYYLEIQRHQYDLFAAKLDNAEIKKNLLEQKENETKINQGVVKLSRELGIPLVATNDAHYIKKEDAEAQDSLVCISTGKNVSDTKRLRFIDAPTFYITSPNKMQELFSDFPDALENTVKIAGECEVELTLDKWFFPNFELPPGKTAEELLREKALDGVKKRISKVTPQVMERLDYELAIIKEKGYATYFLIVADMANWCNENLIVTNTRGSTAGSLTAYALGIININPLNYDLPFERFLTPWRPSPPDIDFDISDNRREEVIEYITKKYGRDKVAQICTFGRMMAKGSVRDIARVLGYPYATGDRISKLIPLGSQGFPMSIDKALGLTPELKNLYDTDVDAKKIINLAKQIEGNARHISVHAAGIVIAPEEIVNYTPVQLDPEGKKIITQYDMETLDPNVSPKEAVGLLKFDLLGLRNLSIMGSTLEILKNSLGVDVNLSKIPLTDAKTFQKLANGETMGVFQLSGGGMTKYIKELKPTRVEDLMAMVALYRPGPMAQIPQYIERKNNPEKVSYFDPRMEEYLGKSYGLLVYQDDVFATAIKIAGYTWEEADKFRKAVGKKIPSEMEKQKAKFIDGAIVNGLTKQKAEDLFALIEPFSGYGFNKAHAASYGMVAYWTAYLKANYPVEFMCALLTAESQDTDKVASAIHECRRMKIKVLPPDINESGVGFIIVEHKDSLTSRGIRFGLNAIKNVGKAAIEAILEARKDGNFTSLVDFLTRVDGRRVNKKVLESLIKVGALSAFGARATLLSKLDDLRSRIVKPKTVKGQEGLFSEDEVKVGSVSLMIEDAFVNEFSDDEIQNLERQLLGFSLTARPVSEVLGQLYAHATHKIDELTSDLVVKETLSIAAVISEVRVIVTKKSGSEMAFVKVLDETGTVDLVVFPKIYQAYKNILLEGKPVVVKGKVDMRDETASLLVDEIYTQETAALEDKKLFIKIPKNTSRDQLLKLRTLLSQNSGDDSVTLIFAEKNNEKVELGIKIAWNTTLAKQITQTLGKTEN